VRLFIVNHFHGPVGAGARAIGTVLGQDIGEGASTVLDTYLGAKLQAWDQVRGSPYIRTGA
jgi:hypothetical protein